MNTFSDRSKGVRGATWVSMALFVASTGFLLAASQGRVAAVPPESDAIVGSELGPEAQFLSLPPAATEPEDIVSTDANSDPFAIGIYCCSGPGGGCVLQAGGCPSGTTSVACPCRPPV